ncbi:MAG: exodeoxyribonuclease VII large subunit [Acidobacteriota bacterium]|nr:exodeoxyribonuclease VII large subunit [Acidobacteriota bacterium]
MRRAGPSSTGNDESPGSRLRPLSVWELNEGADALLADAFGALWVEGEITRFLAHRSGHWYFTLKDSRAAVSCAMFRGRNQRVKFRPADGQQVLVLATAGVYAAAGRYQLVVEAIEPRGAGAAALALAQLKKKLAAEGLFDPDRKKPLPGLPTHIALVTSPEGAAVRDVLRVLRRRFAGVRVTVCPCAVQGDAAPRDIVRALQRAAALEPDVVLLVRGGGSREDLAAFDDESVVRAVAACPVPLVSGIGHEIDTTLADLAADLRAATPSAAAEVVVRERAELRARVAEWLKALARAQRHHIHRRRLRLQHCSGSRGLHGVPLRLERLHMHLGEVQHRLERAVRRRVSDSRRALAETAERLSPRRMARDLAARRHQLAEALQALAQAERGVLAERRRRLLTLTSRAETLSPFAVLSRGYALVTADDRRLVRDAADLRAGQSLHLRFARGAARARVEEILPSPPPRRKPS